MFNWFRKNKQEWRQSSKWISARNRALRRDNHACVICGKRKHLDVHHTYSAAWYPQHRYEVKYLVTLCKVHHMGAHAYMGGTRKRGTPEHFEAYLFYISKGGRIARHLSVTTLLVFIVVTTFILFMLLR